jgi:DNA-binding NtrC family response regulator
VLERAKILVDEDVIRLKDLPKEVILGGTSSGKGAETAPATTVDTTDDLHLFQKQKVLAVLEREAFNKAKAARALGISRRKLYRLLEKYGLADSGIAAPP